MFQAVVLLSAPIWVPCLFIFIGWVLTGGGDPKKRAHQIEVKRQKDEMTKGYASGLITEEAKRQFREERGL